MCQLAVPQDPDILKSHSLAALHFSRRFLKDFEILVKKRKIY